MARPQKIGLEYFPMDVDFFNDIKIRKLIKSQGAKAIPVYIAMLCFIYKSGYYIGVDEEMPFIISELTGYDEVFIREVMRACLTVDLFSAEMFENRRVFTSKGIQERYSSIQNLHGRKFEIGDFCLVSSEKPIVSSEKPIVSSEKPLVNSNLCHKQKENKINKMKLNPPLPPEKIGGNLEVGCGNFNIYDFSPPDDGVARNWDCFKKAVTKELRANSKQQQELCLLSNYGQIGNEFWKYLDQSKSSGIKMPLVFVLKRMRFGE